jgi:hypothetical protein
MEILILGLLLYSSLGLGTMILLFDIYDRIKQLQLTWIKTDINRKRYRMFLYLISTIIMAALGLITAIGIALMLNMMKSVKK